MMLVVTIIPFVACGEVVNELEKNDFKYDVRTKFLFPLFNPLWQRPLRHIDIVSFSIYEDTEESEFLHANMKVRDFSFSKLRTSYVIYFTYDCLCYYIAAGTHTNGEFLSFCAGYFDQDGTGNYSEIEGEINEEESVISWKVPKEKIGNPDIGDEFVNIHAHTFLTLQKKCDVKIPIHLADDIAKPLLKIGYSYSIQY
jgi:hypothetical protein